MVVVLSVAEKPSVAKELANIIGKGNAQKVSRVLPRFEVITDACL